MTELNQLDDFKVLCEVKPGKTLNGFQKLSYQMIFDVKSYLTRKARILPLLTTISKLHLWAAEIGNDFLNGDKIQTIRSSF